MSFARQYIQTVHWAMLPEYVELMDAIGARDEEYRDLVLQAIQKEFGGPVAGARRGRNRDGVAIVSVAGPLFRYAGLMTEISGATSFEELATEVNAAMEDDDVRHLLLDINSPGGEVDGMTETAALIASFRGRKPITSFISHLGASAALVIAGAADEVVGSDMSIVGSLGIVASLHDRRDLDEKRGIRRMEFVSSQSPLKRVDPFSDDASEADRARQVIQNRVNALAKVMLETFAANRGITPEKAAATKGDVFVGAAAIEMGLVDRIGTLEGLIGELTEASDDGLSAITLSAAAGALETTQENTIMSATADGTEKPVAPAITRAFLDANHPELVKAIVAEGFEAGQEKGLETGKTEGATAERDRILGILEVEAEGFDEKKLALMKDPTKTRGDAAMEILAMKGEAEEQRKEKVKDDLKADEKNLEAVKSTGAGGEDDDEEAVANAIAGFAQSHIDAGRTEALK